MEPRDTGVRVVLDHIHRHGCADLDTRVSGDHAPNVPGTTGDLADTAVVCWDIHACHCSGSPRIRGEAELLMPVVPLHAAALVCVLPFHIWDTDVLAV